jgi:hypothetical protein
MAKKKERRITARDLKPTKDPKGGGISPHGNKKPK